MHQSGTKFNKSRDDIQGFYICGRCDTKIFYLANEGINASIPCPDCGWYGAEKREDQLPPIVKIDLTQY